MNAEQFRNIIDGSDRGLSAALYRCVFSILELPYAVVIHSRNRLYDGKYKIQRKTTLPTVSVGNLTLGGTGKTPMTAYLASYFQIKGSRPGIISRGYRKADAAVNDEFFELSLRLSDIPHLQNPNRFAAAQEFAQRTGLDAVDILILDDAFQHRRIKRNADIVLLDAVDPFGNEHLFPRGTLREPLNALKRADAVLLSRADLISVTEREQIKRRVLGVAPNVVWGEVIHQPEYLFSTTQQKNPLSLIRGKKALAFCGIGNPTAFIKTLESCGVSVVKMIPFPDHYRYKKRDLDKLAKEAQQCFAEVVLCTMKDMVKIDRSVLNGIPLHAVSVGIQFLNGELELHHLLEQKLKMEPL